MGWRGVPAGGTDSRAGRRRFIGADRSGIQPNDLFRPTRGQTRGFPVLRRGWNYPPDGTAVWTETGLRSLWTTPVPAPCTRALLLPSRIPAPVSPAQTSTLGPSTHLAAISLLRLSGRVCRSIAPHRLRTVNLFVANAKLYVAYAKQADDRRDDIPGSGNGYVNIFDFNGRLLQRLISGGHLSSPWGMAIAPEKFGDFSKALLVGNFGDGTINAFNVSTGDFLGTLSDTGGRPIVNLGLWSLQFGNGSLGGNAMALYFTAGISCGPDGEAVESHGLFASIQAAPVLSSEGVVNSAGFQKGIAPNAWTSIFGENLSATTRSWQASDFVDNRLPTELDGVSVTIDGKPAYVAYVSPTQLNVLAPSNLPTASISVQTRNNGLAANPASVDSTAVLPAFFQLTKYALATHADGKTLVGPVDLAPGATPARLGDIIVLYGTGSGDSGGKGRFVHPPRRPLLTRQRPSQSGALRVKPNSPV